MIDLSNGEKRGRLLKAIKSSREAMEPFRRVRKELIKDYVGSWYAEGGAENKTLINLINQTARIYTISLAANNPQVLVSTPRSESIAFARRFEVNLNKLIGDMALDQTFRDIVMDAFFCLGCGVVMMRDTDTRFHGLLEAEEDVWLDPGEPWFNRVSLDDLILDMTAKERSKMRYCGHLYRADFEKVMDEPGYSKKVKDKLSPTSRTHHDAVGSVRDIASEYGSAEDNDLKDMIWLMDIWIAENNSIVTMACDQDIEPLIEREWTGSQAGPYKFLSLGDTPDNVIPTSPAVNLKGMHDLQNRLHRRMEDDSDAHRVINVYPPGEEDQAERFRTAERNSWVKGRSPEQIKQFETGGVDQRDMVLATFLQTEFDRMAGNLQAMGGLGSQASTVGQEELIHGQLSKNVADMRLAVVNFASACILDLGRLMWEDQTLELRTSMPVGNSGIQVNADWISPLSQNDDLVRQGLQSPARVGNFEDYEFRVEPYSMVFKTPQQHLQEYFQVLREIAPLWPMFQASGATLNVQVLVKEMARLMNKPEIEQLITFATPTDMLGGDQNTVRSPAVTTRENIRRNVPTGGTAENRANSLIQSLMGGKSQLNGQQQAAMQRTPA